MKKTILIAAVMFFAFSVAAVAQVTGAQFDVSSTPVTTVTSCGKSELTGDIVFTTTVSSLPVVTGTITITYGAPVATAITPTVTAWDTTTLPAVQLSGWVSVLNVTGSQVTIAITPGATVLNRVQIRVTGTKVDVTSPTTTFPIYASVSGTGNSFVVGETSNIPVITSALPALATTITASNTQINSVFGFANGPTYASNVVLTEGYFNAWIMNAGIQLSFSQPPTGVTLTFADLTLTTSGGSVFTLVDSTGAVISTAPSYTSASGAFNVFYKLTTYGDINGTVKETLTVPVSIAAANTTLEVKSVTVSASMYTFGTTPPLYVAGGCPAGPATVLTIVPASTYLMVPFASTVGLYDTAVAIANTTKDPLGSAKPQSGAITFYFYGQDGSTFNYSPTGSTNGLTSGLLPAGGTYSALVSDLLAAAGKPADFTGYIFAVVNATNAHGEYFVTDWTDFTHGALMLVVDMSTAARQANPGPESLKH